jgi:hypothetical protein
MMLLASVCSRKTRCRREIPVIETIAMESPGQQRKDSKPKSNICSFCQRIMERGATQN